MFAAVTIKGKNAPCIVKWTGRKGMLSVKTETYCGEEIDSGDGVLQLPDVAKTCEACQTVLDTITMTMKKKESST